MTNHLPVDTQASYDRLAEVYAQQLFDELAHKPLDRELLTRFAGMLQGKGRVCDLGCGPGQVARYLQGCGAAVFGIDLSSGMVETARRLNPDIEFVQGDMARLDLENDSLAGIAAFYSIIHIPRTEVAAVLAELKRVLKSDGVLLLAFHLGAEVRHIEELWEQPVSLDFAFFEREEMLGYLETAGFQVIEVIERDPYPDVEVATQRLYIFARKP